MRTARTAFGITALMLLAACGGSGDTATVDPGSSAPRSSDSTTDPGAPRSPSGSASTSPDAAEEGLGRTELSIRTSPSAEATAAEQRSYLLTCDPPGGDHPDPASACAVVVELGAQAFAPPPKDQQCTEQYGGSQTATVAGVVDGVAVQLTIDRTDGCGIARWDALAPVLAAPMGGPA